jgi:hypothetical protein
MALLHGYSFGTLRERGGVSNGLAGFESRLLVALEA